MLPMNKKEHENWSKIRVVGSNKYALKTSFVSSIFVFLLYFTVNGYINLQNIDEYIAYNISQADFLGAILLTLLISLFMCSKILFLINEKRYLATSKETPNA